MDERTRELHEAFELLDRNGDGRICTDEIEAALRTLGQKPTREDISALLGAVSTNELSFEQFAALMTDYLDRGTAHAAMPAAEREEAELREAFRVFDTNGDGFIAPDELADVFLSLGEQLSEQEISAMVSATDANEDGLISYEEFRKLMARNS